MGSWVRSPSALPMTGMAVSPGYHREGSLGETCRLQTSARLRNRAPSSLVGQDHHEINVKRAVRYQYCWKIIFLCHRNARVTKIGQLVFSHSSVTRFGFATGVQVMVK